LPLAIVQAPVQFPVAGPDLLAIKLYRDPLALSRHENERETTPKRIHFIRE